MTPREPKQLAIHISPAYKGLAPFLVAGTLVSVSAVLRLLSELTQQCQAADQPSAPGLGLGEVAIQIGGEVYQMSDVIATLRTAPSVKVINSPAV